MASENSDSQETNSTSLVEDSLNISFKNLGYTVRNGLLSRARKTILDGLSGSFNAGELTVIMGHSGAGKSTLLDILAGYTKPTSGSIYENGRIRNERMFRRKSCYIFQDDKLIETLTIKESLTIAAELKLGNHISASQKRQRVEQIIMSLGLYAVENTKAGNLSGGQKKRLTIGLELVSDPPVMFLDEPTSGLDISVAKKLVNLLHLLARQGRTMVITMHQPSLSLLQMVDRLYAVVAGKCAYMGSVPLLLPYLNQLNLPDLRCLSYHDPVEYLIEISGTYEEKLVEKSKNGSNNCWVTEATDSPILERPKLLRITSTNEEISLTLLTAPKENSTNKIILALKSTYSTSFWKQFITLTRRSVLSTWREPSFTLTFISIHGFMALFIGILFKNVGEDVEKVRDNYNFLYFSLMFLMFNAFSAVSIRFPEQIPVTRREHFNRWYTTGAFYASTLLSTLPIQTVCTLLYSILVYWMTGQSPNLIRFTIFNFTLLLVSYVSLCMGLLNGSIFNVKNGVIFGPLMIMPFTIFSGFFLRYRDAPYFFRWMFQISFLKHGLVGLVLSVFGMGRSNFSCPKIFCYYTYPTQLLIDNHMDKEEFTLAIGALFAISFALIATSFVILKIRLKSKW
ncbi:ATP-binding cassette subfamily G member 4 [Bombyx mori]|uniref:ABC transporter domain-containing protein n=1 Tax=Bombyx mori TaxID=7091 RepID=A0A8R2C7N7_BOMMO|nr:ATP-binding cassette sub-family G member 4 isoform X1 [Bombyx mori]